jgi:hypothetical protein
MTRPSSCCNTRKRCKLRGAGDVDHDGAITVSEAYQYAYAQTVRSTLLTRGGPQHPSFRYAVEGQREPILTWLGNGARLTLRALEDGEFVLFDDQESRVIADVHVEQDRQARITLAPGHYVVRKRGKSDLRSARIRLATSDDRVLDEGQMPATALVRLPPKGGLGNLALGVSAGQYWSTFGEDGHLQLQLGPEWERGVWLFRGDAVLSLGTQLHNKLVTNQQSMGVAVSALTGFRIGTALLRGGPLLASELIFQESRGRPSRSGLAVRGGPRLRLDLPITRNIGVYAQADVNLLGVAVDGDMPAATFRAGDLGFFWWGAYGFGINSAW